MKQVLLTFFVGVLFVAQSSAKMLDENVVPGTIILKGKQVEGYIKKMGCNGAHAPWEFQEEISFIPKDAFESGRTLTEKDYMIYSAKKIEGYRYNNDSLSFLSVKYEDLSTDGAKTKPEWKFLRVGYDGAISIFLYYKSPLDIEEPYKRKLYFQEYAKNPDLVYRRNTTDILKPINSMNVEEELDDCQVVVDKFQSGYYNNSKLSEEERSELVNVSDNLLFFDKMRLNAIEDYNKNCN